MNGNRAHARIAPDRVARRAAAAGNLGHPIGMTATQAWLEPREEGDAFVLALGGAWGVDNLAAVDDELRRLHPGKRSCSIDITEVSRLDTAGAGAIWRTRQNWQSDGATVELVGVTDDHQVLLDAVEKQHMEPQQPPRPPNAFVEMVVHLGEVTVDIAKETADLLAFLGQITVALLEAGLARSCTALDWAEASLADLRMAGQGLPIETIARDLSRDFRVPSGDTALIIDVLYTMDRNAALSLLNAAADAARQRVFVRSLDPEAGWRGRFALALERAARPFWPHAGARVDPLPPAVLAAALQQRGFQARIMPCWGHTPFANVLIVAKRRAV